MACSISRPARSAASATSSLAALLGLALVHVGGLARAGDDLVGLLASLLQALAVFAEQLVGFLAGALGRVDRVFDRFLAAVQRRADRGERKAGSNRNVAPKTSSVQTIRPIPGSIKKLPLDATVWERAPSSA